MSPELSLLSIAVSSVALLIGICLWLYQIQYRRSDRPALILLFPPLALVPVYNVVYLLLAGRTLYRIVRRNPAPLLSR